MEIKIKLLLLLLLFLFLCLVSLSGVYWSFQTPIEKREIVKAIEYKHVGKYDYTAYLKPNIIYNQSTLKPGQGRIFRSITENVVIDFTYTFEFSGLKSPANITVEYSTIMYLRTSKWNIKFSELPGTASNFTGTTAQFSTTYPINISSVEETAKKIDSEIGVYSSQYNLTINIPIHTVANTVKGTVNENFNPVLSIVLKYRTGEGDYISIEDLLHTNSGTLVGVPRTIYQGWVVSQRYASIAFSMVSVTCLTITVLAYLKTRPVKRRKKRRKPLEEIIEPFEEILANTAKEPLYENRRITVTMKSIEDLVKVADGLEKPILHTERASSAHGEKPTHVFYVLDDLVTYECIISTRGYKRGK